MKWLLALGGHVLLVALVLKHVHPEAPRGKTALADLRGLLPNTVPSDAWSDWLYATELLALDRPLYRTRMDESPESEVWRDRRWGELAWEAQLQGDLDLALALRERFRPRSYCGFDIFPDYAAWAYADLCYQLGRQACFLNLALPLAANKEFMEVSGPALPEFSGFKAARLRALGIDVARLFRGLLYQFPLPGQQRLELEPVQLATAATAAGLADVMADWFQGQTDRSDLDRLNRQRASEALNYLRRPPGGR